jgi:hypothetical protein
MAKRKLSETQRVRKAIRDLEHWLFHGNTATKPGGRFRRSIDFIIAVDRVARFASETIRLQKNAKRPRSRKRG